MKKLATKFQTWLYGTRMQIELHPRSLKMFYGLVTSMPRSVDGYFANYIYSLLAYQAGITVSRFCFSVFFGLEEIFVLAL